jgi:AraC-like DNA-binding protein
MRTKMVELAAGVGFALHDLRITATTRSWSAPERGRTHRLVFVRRGLFRLRLDGWTGLVDPTTAYIGHPGDEQRIAHRPGIEDTCLVIAFDRRLAADVLVDGQPKGMLHTTARTDLAQRMLVARARQGADGFELAERVVRLAAELCGQVTTPAPRRLVEEARELLVTDPVGLSLDRLAGALGVSRSHLSRTFHAGTGQTLTAFRRRQRVGLALDRLEAGERDLARLAVELGFADHAHLTRTMRAELGNPPSRLRTNLQAHPRGPVRG